MSRDRSPLTGEDLPLTRREIEQAARGVGCVRCGDEEAPTESGLCVHCDALEADAYLSRFASRIPELSAIDPFDPTGGYVADLDPEKDASRPVPELWPRIGGTLTT